MVSLEVQLAVTMLPCSPAPKVTLSSSPTVEAFQMSCPQLAKPRLYRWEGLTATPNRTILLVAARSTGKFLKDCKWLNMVDTLHAARLGFATPSWSPCGWACEELVFDGASLSEEEGENGHPMALPDRDEL